MIIPSDKSSSLFPSGLFGCNLLTLSFETRLAGLFRHDLTDVEGVAHDIGLLEEALGRFHGNDTVIQAENWLLV